MDKDMNTENIACTMMMPSNDEYSFDGIIENTEHVAAVCVWTRIHQYVINTCVGTRPCEAAAYINKIFEGWPRVGCSRLRLVVMIMMCTNPMNMWIRMTRNWMTQYGS